jgi:hypothetical protein
LAEKVPSDQYVLLVDPLGSTEAVKTSSGGRMNALIELMHWTTTARPEFGVRVAPDGNCITPDISTFSDLAVISFPVTPPLDLPPDQFALPQTAIAVKWAWHRQYFERGTSGI